MGTEEKKKVFDMTKEDFEKVPERGGYTRIIKLNERRGDDALEVKLELV